MFSALLLAATLVMQVADPQAFAGTWVAQLKDQPFARLELNVRNGQVQGQLSLAGFHVGPNGEVDAITSGLEGPVPIFDVVLRDGELVFARKDVDDTDRFELRLVDGRAALTLVVDAALRAELAQEGIPSPRPFSMTRTGR